MQAVTSTDDTATTKAMMARSRTAARLSLGASTLFLVLLVVLHVIKPEVDPSWQMISEYAIGRYGWIMTLAFLALTVSYVALFIAIRSQLRTIVGRIGLALLLVSAVGLAMGGIFTTDPSTVSPDAMTPSGRLHGWGFLLGVPTFPIAATLICWGLTRNQGWASARRSLVWMACLVWLSILVFVVSMATMFKGTFGPDVLIGWQNRLLMLAYTGWVMVAAWHAAQLSRESPVGETKTR
jgi:hypothetical protein